MVCGRAQCRTYDKWSGLVPHLMVGLSAASHMVGLSAACKYGLYFLYIFLILIAGGARS